MVQSMFKVGDVIMYHSRDDSRTYELMSVTYNGRAFVAQEFPTGVTKSLSVKYIMNHMRSSDTQYLPYSHRS